MRKLITLFAFIALFLVSCKHEVYYSITTKVQPDGTGSIVVSPSSDQVQEGTTVSFTAKPNGEYVLGQMASIVDHVVIPEEGEE